MSVMAQVEEKSPNCPRCGSEKTIFYGWARGSRKEKRKARCHSCMRFFTVGGKLR